MFYPEYHNDECRGCCLLKKCAIKNVQPQYTKEFNIPFCPCMNCLVKVVCSETCNEKKSYDFIIDLYEIGIPDKI
jgi:hypothetical protein